MTGIPLWVTQRLWLALQSWWGAFQGRTAEESAELARRALHDGRIFNEQPDLPPPGQAILVLARAEKLDLALDRVDAYAAGARGRGSAVGMGQASYLRAYVEYLRGDVSLAVDESSGTGAGIDQSLVTLGRVARQISRSPSPPARSDLK